MPCFASKLKRNILSIVVHFTISVPGRFFSFFFLLTEIFGNCRFEDKKKIGDVIFAMSVDLPEDGIRYLGRNFLSVKVSEVVRV